jgi:hypothetical protein
MVRVEKQGEMWTVIHGRPVDEVLRIGLCRQAVETGDARLAVGKGRHGDLVKI